MSNFDVFAMAGRSLFKRKVRTFLTVMGVVIGCAAITVMMSLGIAINMTFDEQVEAMGESALFIQVSIWGNDPDIRRFHQEDIDYLNSLESVRIASEMITTSLVLTHGRYSNTWGQIIGIRPEVFPYIGAEVIEGRGIMAGDDLQIVFGTQTAMEFFNHALPNPWMFPHTEPPFEPVGAAVLGTFSFGGEEDQGRIRPYNLEVVGVLGEPTGNNWDAMWSSYMHIDMVRQIQEDRLRFEAAATGGRFNPWTQPQTGYDRAIIMASDFDQVMAVVAILNDMGFEHVWADMSWIEMQRESTAALQNLLSAIGGVSLFIAAIGIANTMIMSIYERTKEIGVMKVIGASLKDIRKLFLVEAGMIGALGGIFGVAVSFGVSYALNHAGLDFLGGAVWRPMEETVISHIPLWLYGLAFGFSCVIGIVSGFLPARRATKISALTAIKTD